MDSYSLADIAAVNGGNNFGGNSMWLIVLFALIFGWGGMGNRDGFGQYATAASQQEILFGQQFQNLDNKMDRLGNGIADATFALNNSIKDGNAAVTGAVVAEGRGIQQGLDGIRFEMNQNTAKILDTMAQDKIASLQAQVSELKMQNMFCGVPRVSPYAYQIEGRCGCGCGTTV